MSGGELVTKPFTFGGEGSGSDPDIYALLLKNAFGAKLKLISGYPGTAEIAIALERGGKPDADLATAVAEGAARRGLLLLKAGIYSNCIRVLVPLVIADAELDEALDVWEEALTEALV